MAGVPHENEIVYFVLYNKLAGVPGVARVVYIKNDFTFIFLYQCMFYLNYILLFINVILITTLRTLWILFFGTQKCMIRKCALQRMREGWYTRDTDNPILCHCCKAFKVVVMLLGFSKSWYRSRSGFLCWPTKMKNEFKVHKRQQPVF